MHLMRVCLCVRTTQNPPLRIHTHISYTYRYVGFRVRTLLPDTFAHFAGVKSSFTIPIQVCTRGDYEPEKVFSLYSINNKVTIHCHIYMLTRVQQHEPLLQWVTQVMGRLWKHTNYQFKIHHKYCFMDVWNIDAIEPKLVTYHVKWIHGIIFWDCKKGQINLPMQWRTSVRRAHYSHLVFAMVDTIHTIWFGRFTDFILMLFHGYHFTEFQTW